MKYIKQILIVVLLICSLSAGAQKLEVKDSDYSNNEVEMADAMRSNGKIYVLVAVIGSIFGGIVFYLIHTDRKVSRLEKELKK